MGGKIENSTRECYKPMPLHGNFSLLKGALSTCVKDDPPSRVQIFSIDRKNKSKPIYTAQGPQLKKNKAPPCFNGVEIDPIRYKIKNQKNTATIGFFIHPTHHQSITSPTLRQYNLPSRPTFTIPPITQIRRDFFSLQQKIQCN